MQAAKIVGRPTAHFLSPLAVPLSLPAALCRLPLLALLHHHRSRTRKPSRTTHCFLPCAGLLEGMPAERPPLLALLQGAVPLLLADLEAQGQALDEQLYLQLARVAGIMGDPDKVRLQWHSSSNQIVLWMVLYGVGRF